MSYYGSVEWCTDHICALEEAVADLRKENLECARRIEAQAEVILKLAKLVEEKED